MKIIIMLMKSKELSLLAMMVFVKLVNGLRRKKKLTGLIEIIN